MASEDSKKYTTTNKVVIRDENGNVIDKIDAEPGVEYNKTPFYKKADGTWTTDPLEVSRFTITNDGAIKLTAPKEVFELPEFSRIFDEDTIKSYSTAYRSNPSYRVPYTKRNDDGTTEETQITIPEFVNELNDALQNFIENYKVAEENKASLIDNYGEKAKNLSLTEMSDIAGSNASATSIYLPDVLFSIESSFSPLEKKRDERGRVSTEEFMKYYQLGVTSETELANILALLEGHLKGSDWGEDEVVFEDGTVYKNPNSHTEAARALALKNFILSKDPDADWHEALGAGAATLAVNAAEGIAKVFMNLGTTVEGIATFGQVHVIQNATEEMDKAMSGWNEQRALIQDSTATLATLGQIGGMIAGTAIEIHLMGAAAKDIAKIGKGIAGKAATKTLLAADADATAEALTQAALSGKDFSTALAGIASNMHNISLGAKFTMSVIPIVNRVAIATQVAKSLMEAHKGMHQATAFLIDTVHDAIRYDAVTLRHVIEGSDDQNVKDYWLGQLEDNAKWWAGMGFAQTAFQFAGKTNFGIALGAKSTQKIKGLTAKIGDIKDHIKDYVYGGDFVRHMEEMANNLPNGAKKNRLNTKIALAKQAKAERELYRALANLDLEWDGLKLADDSLSEFRAKMKALEDLEDATSMRNVGLAQKEMEIFGYTKNPATGRMELLNPDLGTKNAAATELYGKILGYTQDYGLKKAVGSNLSEDMVDYIGGTIEKTRKLPIAEGSGPDASLAMADVLQIDANLDAIRSRLPEDVVAFLDDPATIKTYIDFYTALRDYQRQAGIINAELLDAYRRGEDTDNYAPVQKAVNAEGRFERFDNTTLMNIEEEIDHFKYGVKEGQHYVDPEITRQRWMRRVAEEELSKPIKKAWDEFFGSSEVVLASGDETQRAIKAGVKKSDLEKAVAFNADGFTQNWSLDTAKPAKSRKFSENIKWDEAERAQVAATLSLDNTTQILQRYNVLKGGNTRISNLVNADNYEAWFDSQSNYVKNYLNAEYSKYGAKTGTYDLFKRAVQEGGDDFEAGLQRAYLIGDENFGSKGLMTVLINDMLAGRDSFGDGYIKLEARQALRNVRQIDTDNFVDSLYKSIEEATNDYVLNVMESPVVNKAMDALAISGENGSALAAKYTALEYLTKGDGKKNLQKIIEKEIRADFKGKGLKSDDVDLIVKRANEMTSEYIKAQFNETRNALGTINKELIDSKDLFKETKALADKITSVRKESRLANSDIVMYLDDQGRQVYAKVDPNFASIYKLRRHMSNTDASAFAKFNAATSKLFRYGTTTLNLSSFSNQLFRDTGNALIVGGAWDTIRRNAENLREVFGDDIIEQIKRFAPEKAKYELQQISDYAKEYNVSMQEAAANRELLRGAALSPATTETTLYRTILKTEGMSDASGIIDNMDHGLKKVLNKFQSVDEWTNGKREVYLRNRVYANSFTKALEQGYTLEQARSWATYAMNNATTNFTRQIYHMQAIADSTPYFKAAINGTKSFWRMWSMDPVGITGRMMGGLILPVMFLTGASVGDPDNREVYKNIPEYQKDENLIFVVDKQVITIPIPQEMANIVAPFRQFVEYLHDSNESDFWELMMNDALGFSPVELTGFTTIDMDKMSQDPTISDRIERGFARIFSQIAPVPVRSTYMMVTGTDPYTGKNLYDPSYTYWDDDTNSIQTMNDYQNAFAKWVAKLWGKDSNAAVLEKVTSSIFGSTGANVLGELVTLIEKGPEASGGQLAQDVVEQATNPYYANAYNQADAVWKRTVRALTAEKDAITSSDEFKTIYSELSQTKDEEKRKKLIAKGQDLINEYQNKVITTVERLSSVYNGTYDRKKFAATIQLLNFNTDPIYQAGTQYSSNIASDAYYEGRESAISTMQALGVTGTNDLSIFGYLTTDDYGNPVMKYTSPVAIMDMKNAWMGAGDVDTANIEAKLKTDGIKQSDMWDGYYAAKNKGKAALKQYKSAWNAKVVKSLAPYISERGVDSVMKDTATRDLLDNYLFIDNLYQTKAYLKKIFENA